MKPHPRVRRGILAILAGIAWRFLLLPVKAQFVPVYTVNTTSDAVLVGACESGGAGCSLRGAIQAADSVSDSVITFSIAELCASTGCVINLTHSLPTIFSKVTLEGPGSGNLTVRRDTGADYSIFVVHKSIGRVIISGLTISNGYENGGGLFVGNADVDLINCTITGNFGSNGGGIFNQGTLNVINSTISANSAEYGGGIYNEGSLILTNSTVAGNTASGRPGHGGTGGAISNVGTLTLTNCTISGNSALNGGLGGGIENVVSDAVTLRSSIIASNTAMFDPDVSGLSFASQGFNLIGNNEGESASFPVGNPNANNDIVGSSGMPVNPKLDPNGLRNNGGPIQTIALLLGSPAVDKGTAVGLSGNLTTDQRGTGFPRIFEDSAIGNATGGDGADIGAFELQTGQPTKFANVSSRLPVQTGDDALFAGFIITGTQSKKVMLRAIGPSLNLLGQLENPTLELFQGNDLLGSNDDWQNQPAADRQAVIDTTIPPSNDLESALVRTLPANSTAFTAVVRGANNGTGIGIIEVYDLDRLIDSKLANISTRGFVQTGDNVLIAGTIVLGNAAQKVIVRALGPSLTVSGKMADPTLELRDGNGHLIEANDNWKDSPNKQAIIDSTIPPTNDLESAMVQVLPGNGAIYTAVLRGVNDTTGVAVVEVYALQ